MKRPSLSDIIEAAIEVADSPVVSERTSAVMKLCQRNPDDEQVFQAYVETARLLSDQAHARDTQDRTADCLDDNDLSALAEGVLSGGAYDNACSHLAACAYCRKELIQLHRLLQQVEPLFPNVLEFVIHIVHKGVELLKSPAIGYSAVQLAPVPVLGPGEAVMPAGAVSACAWKQEAAPFSLDFSAIHIDTEHLDLCLRVTRDDAPISGTCLMLYKDGRLLQSETIPPGGRLKLHNLHCGSYNLELCAPSEGPLRFSIKLSSE